ncbi:MAG: SurA N-terminal domain-containing protein [Bdellovibrionales bacterium]|nr:SurA N-terminal domain-containing protein [Bdellovibrionales bacterium]
MKTLFLPTLILSLWVFSGCSFFNKNPVVLQINSDKLTSRQFAKRLAQKIHSLNIQEVKNQELIENLKRQLVTDLIMETLIKQWAKSHSISISKKELHQELQKIKSKYPDKEAFEWYLKRKKTKVEEWTEHIKNNLLSQKVMQKMGSKTPPPL